MFVVIFIYSTNVSPKITHFSTTKSMKITYSDMLPVKMSETPQKSKGHIYISAR